MYVLPRILRILLILGLRLIHPFFFSFRNGIKNQRNSFEKFSINYFSNCFSDFCSNSTSDFSRNIFRAYFKYSLKYSEIPSFWKFFDDSFWSSARFFDVNFFAKNPVISPGISLGILTRTPAGIAKAVWDFLDQSMNHPENPTGNPSGIPPGMLAGTSLGCFQIFLQDAYQECLKGGRHDKCLEFFKRFVQRCLGSSCWNYIEIIRGILYLVSIESVRLT